jgi:hypothetical protein
VLKSFYSPRERVVNPEFVFGLIESAIRKGVLPTVVSPGAIWTEIEPGFHIELETAVRIDVLPNKRRDGAQIRRRQPPGPVRTREHLLHHEGVNINHAVLQEMQR